MNHRAVFFDAYDTTVTFDKTPSSKRVGVYGLLLSNLNLPVEELKKFRRLCKTENISFEKLAGMIKMQYKNISLKEIKTMQQLLKDECNSIRFYEDTDRTIAKLKSLGYKVGMISNLAKPYGEAMRPLLSNFDTVVYSYEVGYEKPEKEIFTYAAEKIGVPLEECIMIGNHNVNDVSAPISYGMKGVLVSRNHNKNLDTILPYPNISTLDELEGIL